MLKLLRSWLTRMHRNSRTVRPLWAIFYALAFGFMVVSVLRYHQPEYGYTVLLDVGDRSLESRDWTAERDVRVFKTLQSHGYDGQYYAQLALDPGLSDPALQETVDNLAYRARRMLLPWVAHVLGLGNPGWILNAFALLNLGCWVVLSLVLLRWFPPVSLDRAIRWFGVLFSAGMCSSMTASLVDGPSLLFLALAVFWWEKGHRIRASLALALGGLTKETTILGNAIHWPDNPRSLNDWMRTFGRVVLAVLPLGIWLIYLNLRFAEGSTFAGERNFAWPLRAVFLRASELWSELTGESESWRFLALSWATLISIMVQTCFLLLRWQWKQPAWRLTVPFAGLALVIGSANWDGYPGSVGRSLLPLLLGFNLLVPSARRWLPLLVLGNLTVFWGLSTFPPRPGSEQVVEIKNTAGAVYFGAERSFEIDFPRPWFGLESNATRDWRWSSGDAEIMILNPYASDLRVALAGRLGVSSDRQVRLLQDSAVLWEGEVGEDPVDWQVAGVILPPGTSVLRIESDEPPTQIHDWDERMLSFCLFRFEVRGETIAAGH